MRATHGRIWEAASSDDSRPVLTYVKFDAEKATLTATNSYIAARVPCEVEDGDESGLIPAVALKTAKGQSLRVADGWATLEWYGERRQWRLLAGERGFPDVEEILSGYQRIEQPYGLNTDLLRALSQALGCGTSHNRPVALHPSSPLKAMYVADANEEAAFGAIMPVRLASQPWPEHHEPQPDFSNPEVIVAASRAAVAAMEKRRGKAKAADAFRQAAIDATAEIAASARERKAA